MSTDFFRSIPVSADPVVPERTGSAGERLLEEPAQPSQPVLFGRTDFLEPFRSETFRTLQEAASLLRSLRPSQSALFKYRTDVLRVPRGKPSVWQGAALLVEAPSLRQPTFFSFRPHPAETVRRAQTGRRAAEGLPS